MNVKQVDIFYSDNSLAFFEELLDPLQELFSQQLFNSWSISREWIHGPHFRLLFNVDDFFFSDELFAQGLEKIEIFLQRYPCEALAEEEYRRKQYKLMAIEKVVMDPDRVDANNQYRVTDCQSTELSGRYENEQQWLSVFCANCHLRPFIIDQRLNNHSGHPSQQALFDIMMLLALVYQPKVSDEADFGEFNGFLSYYSNYTFWHHSLSEQGQQNIRQTFERQYQEDQAEFQAWAQDLQTRLQNRESTLARYVHWLKLQFGKFTQMAVDQIIHHRSPYPREQLANIRQVSDFHRKYFYTEEGRSSGFPTDFSSYRWLLNIVYRILPLLNFTPVNRQYYNYSLSRYEVENRDSIYALRESLYRF